MLVPLYMAAACAAHYGEPNTPATVVVDNTSTISTVYSAIRLNADGTISVRGPTSAWADHSEGWWSTPRVDIGSLYEQSIVITGGDTTPQPSLAQPTWYTIDGSANWGITDLDSAASDNTANFTVYIRKASDSSAVLNFNVQLTANRVV